MCRAPSEPRGDCPCEHEAGRKHQHGTPRHLCGASDSSRRGQTPAHQLLNVLYRAQESQKPGKKVSGYLGAVFPTSAPPGAGSVLPQLAHGDSRGSRNWHQLRVPARALATNHKHNPDHAANRAQLLPHAEGLGAAGGAPHITPIPEQTWRGSGRAASAHASNSTCEATCCCPCSRGFCMRQSERQRKEREDHGA